MAAVGLDNTLSMLGLSRTFATQLARSYEVRTQGKTGAELLLLSQLNAMNLQGQQGSNGAAMPASGWVPRPADSIGANPSTLAAVGNGFGGFNAAGGLGSDPLMQSLQTALASNPQFRTQLESALGGQVIGSNGSVLSVWQPSEKANTIGRTTRGLLKQAPPAGSIQHSFGTMGVQVSPQSLGGSNGSILRGLQQMEANIASFASSMNSAAGGLSPAVLDSAKKAGINTQNPAFEELVFLNMMNFTVTKEKDIMGKVNQLGQNAGAVPGSVSGTPAAQEGFFGGLTAAVGGTTARDMGVDVPSLALPMGVQAQVAAGGPAPLTGFAPATGVTAAAPGQAAGGPQQIVDAQGNVVNPGAMSETAKQQMLQKMMNDLQKFYEMLSNIMKTSHDMQKSIINNVRA